MKLKPGYGAGMRVLLSAIHGEMRRAGRRFLRRHGLCRTRLMIVGATLFLAFAPLGVMTGNNAVQAWLSNRAMAATDASVDEDVALREGMLTSRQKRIARSLRDAFGRKPESILGAKADDVLLALAAPGLLRREGMAQAWQYLVESCVMDVFLSDGVVVDFEVRGRNVAVLRPERAEKAPVPDAAVCMRKVAQAGQDAPVISLAMLDAR